MQQDKRDYKYYKNVFKGQNLPFAFVDMDLLEENARKIVLRSGEKKIRIASKSIRCEQLLKKILELDTAFQGIMCFTIPEAVYLSKQGFDDLLVAYPSVQENYIADVCQEIRNGKTIVLMADSEEHITSINDVAFKHSVTIPLCMDVDMSSDFPGLYFGVWRSGITTAKQTLDLAEKIKQLDNISLDGIMGYEAQIAGVGDNYPGQALKNAVVKFLKNASVRKIAKKRKEIIEILRSAGAELRFINGGGTGSLESTICPDFDRIIS